MVKSTKLAPLRNVNVSCSSKNERGFGIYIVQKSNLKIMNPVSKQLRAKLSDRKKRHPKQKKKCVKVVDHHKASIAEA